MSRRNGRLGYDKKLGRITKEIVPFYDDYRVRQRMNAPEPPPTVARELTYGQQLQQVFMRAMRKRGWAKRKWPANWREYAAKLLDLEGEGYE